MKLDEQKERYTYRLTLPICIVVMLCLLLTAISITKTHAAQATSSATQSSRSTTPVIQSIRMVNQSVGWATANTTTILHTVTGGKQWTNVTPQYKVAKPQSFITTFKNASTGWIAYESTIGDNTFTILRTTDGGKSWQSSTVSTTQGFGVQALTFNGTQNGWLMVGNNGGPGAGSESFALFSTKNGGQSWKQLPDVHTSDQGVKLFFTDTKNGYLTYGGPYATPHMSITHDGGYSWQSVALPAVKGSYTSFMTTPPVFFGSLGFLPIGSEFNSSFTIFTSHDGGVSWQANGSVVTLGQGSTNLTGIGDLYIVDPQHFYVTNEQGQTLLSNDGGVSWHTVSGNVGSGVTSLSFITAQEGWAAGNGLLHTTDGGKNWQKVNYTVQ